MTSSGQSDNGGPSFTGDNHTANNYPLRGAKYSNWEGGVRVNAFVSGGFLAKVAAARLGSKLAGLIHICDYYATFAALAGVDKNDTRAALAGLPAVDGLDMWPYLSGATDASPRTEVWNDLGVIIVGEYKLYNGSGPYGSLLPDGSATENHACFPGMIYPNGYVQFRRWGAGALSMPRGVHAFSAPVRILALTWARRFDPCLKTGPRRPGVPALGLSPARGAASRTRRATGSASSFRPARTAPACTTSSRTPPSTTTSRATPRWHTASPPCGAGWPRLKPPTSTQLGARGQTGWRSGPPRRGGRDTGARSSSRRDPPMGGRQASARIGR